MIKTPIESVWLIDLGIMRGYAGLVFATKQLAEQWAKENNIQYVEIVVRMIRYP